MPNSSRSSVSRTTQTPSENFLITRLKNFENSIGRCQANSELMNSDPPTKVRRHTVLSPKKVCYHFPASSRLLMLLTNKQDETHATKLQPTINFMSLQLTTNQTALSLPYESVHHNLQPQGARVQTTSVTISCLEPPPQGESNQRQDLVPYNASTPTAVLCNEATVYLLPKQHSIPDTATQNLDEYLCSAPSTAS